MKVVHIDKMPLGIIYCLKEEGTNYYKIGVTRSTLGKRLPSIQTGNPRKLEVIRMVHIREYYLNIMEKELHMDFGCLHTFAVRRGEWFHLEECPIENLNRYGREGMQ